MATVSRLSAPGPAASASPTLKPRSSQPKILIGLYGGSSFNAKVSSSRLAVRNNPAIGGPLVYVILIQFYRIAFIFRKSCRLVTLLAWSLHVSLSVVIGWLLF